MKCKGLLWAIVIVVGAMNLILSADNFCYLMSGHFLFFDANLQSMRASDGIWLLRFFWWCGGLGVWTLVSILLCTGKMPDL